MSEDKETIEETEEIEEETSMGMKIFRIVGWILFIVLFVTVGIPILISVICFVFQIAICIAILGFMAWGAVETYNEVTGVKDREILEDIRDLLKK